MTAEKIPKKNAAARIARLIAALSRQFSGGPVKMVDSANCHPLYRTSNVRAVRSPNARGERQLLLIRPPEFRG